MSPMKRNKTIDILDDDDDDDDKRSEKTQNNFPTHNLIPMCRTHKNQRNK